MVSCIVAVVLERNDFIINSAHPSLASSQYLIFLQLSLQNRGRYMDCL